MRVTLARNRGALAEVEDANVIKTEHVVGVAVSQQDQIHAIDPVLESLRTQIGRRVDKDRRSAIELQIDRGSRPLIFRVR